MRFSVLGFRSERIELQAPVVYLIFTSDPNPTALSDVYRLFTTVVHLAIQVACFDAIFDCITNMIGRLFNLHIVKSTSSN